jgi:hypothetical protein
MYYPIARLAARRTLGLALLVFSLSPLRPAHAQSQNAAGAELELRAAEAKLAAALSSADVDQLSRLWADDFVSTMADGRVTSGKKRLDALRARKPDASSRVTNENQQVDVHVKRDGQWRLIAAHISEVKP